MEEIQWRDLNFLIENYIMIKRGKLAVMLAFVLVIREYECIGFCPYLWNGYMYLQNAKNMIK